MIAPLSSLLRTATSNVRLIPVCSMYTHPYVDYCKKRSLVSTDFPKKTTGLTGLYVDEHPHHNLRVIYSRLLKILEKMPTNYAYRRHTEDIVRARLSVVESEDNILKIEEKIGMGQIEEVRQQAEYEMETARELLSSKAWESLLDVPSESQWRWPIC